MALSKVYEQRLKELSEEILNLWLLTGKLDLVIVSGNELKTIETLPDKQKQLLKKGFDMCNSYLTELEEKGFSVNTIKYHQSKFRQLLREKTGISQYRQLPLCLMSYDKEKINAKNDEYEEKIQNQNTQDLIPLSRLLVDNYIEKGIELLNTTITNNKTLAKVVIGLAILTGRRVYEEICFKASFEKHIENDFVFFKGQAKGSKEKSEKPFKIPVLGVNSEIIIEKHKEVIEYLNSLKWYKNLKDNSEETIKENCLVVRNNLKNYLKSITILEVLPLFYDLIKKGYEVELEGDNSKEYRKIYACIIHQNYIDKTGIKIDFTDYIAQYLGHTSEKTFISGNTKLSTKTSKSYKKYYIS